MHHPLGRFPIAHSNDLGKLRDAVDGMTAYEHAVSQSSRQTSSLAGVVNGVQLQGLSLAYVAYSTPVTVFAPATDRRVVVVIPLGPMEVEAAGTRRRMTESFILPSVGSARMLPDPFAGALVGAVSVDLLTDLLTTTFCDRLQFDLELMQPHPLPLNGERALRRSWLTQAQNDERLDSTDMLDALAVGLINVSKYRLHYGGTRHQLPSYVLSAAQYFRLHFAEPINLAQLSHRIGISSRQLQLAFRAHLGVTPKAYLRELRLEHAMNLLASTNPPAIADIAMAVGMPHLGRFAQYFTQRFGIRPSEYGHERRRM